VSVFVHVRVATRLFCSTTRATSPGRRARARTRGRCGGSASSTPSSCCWRRCARGPCRARTSSPLPPVTLLSRYVGPPSNHALSYSPRAQVRKTTVNAHYLTLSWNFLRVCSSEDRRGRYSSAGGTPRRRASPRRTPTCPRRRRAWAPCSPRSPRKA
jgi:hypothetical protein